MKKVTLSFPDYDSMWSFRNKSTAINVRIEPRKNIISGLFSKEELDVALNEFKAVEAVPVSTTTPQPVFAKTEAVSQATRIRSRFNQFFAAFNLMG